MWVDHRKVVWSVRLIGVREADEHGAVNGIITLKGLNIRLNGFSGVDGAVHLYVHERRIRRVELRHPNNVLRILSGGRGNIRVVRSNRHAWSLPLQVDLTAWVGQGDRAVL